MAPLTEAQMAHFHAFVSLSPLIVPSATAERWARPAGRWQGFLVLRSYLTPEEIQRYGDDFDAGIAEFNPEATHPPTGRLYAGMMGPTTPFMAELAGDPRFADVAEQLIGSPNPWCIACDGNRHVGATEWHPDIAPDRTPGHPIGNYRAVKFCIYPDALDANSGALRVIPGSHRDPLHTELRSFLTGDDDRSTAAEAAFGILGAKLPSFSFDSQPGDVLVFTVSTFRKLRIAPLRTFVHLTWLIDLCTDASFGGEAGRRQGVMVYVSALDLCKYPSYPKSDPMSCHAHSTRTRRNRSPQRPW